MCYLCKKKELIFYAWGTLGKRECLVYNREIVNQKKICLLDIRRRSTHFTLKSCPSLPSPAHFLLAHSNLTPLKFPWPSLTTLSSLFHFMSLYTINEQFSLYLWQLFFFITTPVVLNSVYLWAKRLLSGLFKNRRTTIQLIWCSKLIFLSKKQKGNI